MSSLKNNKRMLDESQDYMELEFIKMHGIGNDFVILDDRKGNIVQYENYSILAKKLCSRRFGIGADGIVLILDSKDHDIKFKVFNSDGSEAQMCGNAMRCVAKYLYENKIITQKTIRVETQAGTIISNIILNDQGQVQSVKVDMGKPELLCKNIPFKSKNKKAIEESLKPGENEFFITAVSMGNPHAVIFVDDVTKIDVKSIGRSIEIHERFPEKTNVEFVEIVNSKEMKMKVWERGAGITLACGTGACASLVAANLTNRTSDRAVVHLDGGDLEIFWDKDLNHVFKTGTATEVYKGQIRI